MLTRRGKRLPSDRLSDLLGDQGLMECARWSECEPIVRELARELPDFDSVWLDAMVQRQLLTPWQASQLQLERPGRLVVGGRQLREPLGSTTFLALARGARSLEIMKSVAGSGERMTALLETVKRSGAKHPRSIVLPALAEPDDNSSTIWLSSAWILGWDFSELLVRGGRLPWQAVAEVGRELLQALAWFESAGLLHGEIVLRNLRLTPAGRIVLVDPFSRRLSQARPTPGQPLSLRHCEGIAPELFGSARPADARSEIHAAGCLLWQLLTARAPVASADPVRRMLCLRDHDIPDVRGLVPDCPEWLARLLLSMTRRLPELRPARIADVAAAWTADTPSGFGGLRRVVQQLPDRHQRRAAARAPRIRPRAAPKFRRLLLASSLISAVGMLAFFRPELLTLAMQRTPDAPAISLPSATESELDILRRQSTTPQPLPEPDADGVVRLVAGQSWFAVPMRTSGPLIIESTGPGCARILVSPDKPWILQAETVELRGLQIQQRPVDASVATVRKAAAQLTAIQCRSLTIEDCAVQSPSAADEFSGISWYEPPGGSGQITVRRSVFAGGGYGFAMNHPPESLNLENVLLACRGGGMLCEISDARRTHWKASLDHITQRFGFSVVDFVVHDGGVAGPQRLDVELACNESVFQPRMAIVRVKPGDGWKSTSIGVRINAMSDTPGIPAMVPPETEPAVYIDRSLGQPAALPETQLPDPQLLYADLQFAEEGTGPWATAELVDFEGPRLNELLPGCNVRELPALVAQ